MGLDISNPKQLYLDLREHVGHELEVVSYGAGMNVTIECIDCGCVLIEADEPDLE